MPCHFRLSLSDPPSLRLLQDVTLPSGHTLPRGCVVLVSPHFTHKDPDVWPDPDVFDPDRFLPENSLGRHPHSFIPFRSAPRSLPLGHWQRAAGGETPAPPALPRAAPPRVTCHVCRSAGTRSCIGQRFVMMFLKTAAATLLRRFHLRTAEDGPRRVRDIKPIFSLTLHVKGGTRIRVRRRPASHNHVNVNSTWI